MKRPEKLASRLHASLQEIQKLPKSKGRRYSKQHREVVFEAFRSGMSLSDIHGLTSVPMMTLRSWRARDFDESFTKIDLPLAPMKSSAQAFLVLGDSMRIELSVDDLTAELIQRLRQAI